jgi:hypothetical protein
MVYLVMGLLTLAHWELVWLKDDPDLNDIVWTRAAGLPDRTPWNRTTTTILFGPGIMMTWPSYWVTMYRLGPWAWVPNYKEHT